MAATTLVREVVDRITAHLQDGDPQFNRWAERDLTNALSDGQQAICTFLPVACSEVYSLKLAPGTLQTIDTIVSASLKLPDGTAPGVTVYGNALLDLVCRMGADGATPGRALRRVGRDLLDLHSPDWHSQTSASGPREWTFDPEVPQRFFVNPGVPATGGPFWVRSVIALNPPRVPQGAVMGGTPLYDRAGSGTGGSTRISVDDEYVEPLVNYVVARANLMDQDFANAAKAQAFAGMFMSWLNAKITAVKGTNPNLKMLPFAPEPLARAS